MSSAEERGSAGSKLVNLPLPTRQLDRPPVSLPDPKPDQVTIAISTKNTPVQSYDGLFDYTLNALLCSVAAREPLGRIAVATSDVSHAVSKLRLRESGNIQVLRCLRGTASVAMPCMWCTQSDSRKVL